MFKFFCSKKGFTFVELMAVVTILGILTAVAVPLFISGLNNQKRKDCQNQCIVMETVVKQAMYGMIDNGAKQEEYKEGEVVVKEEIDIAGWGDGPDKIQYNPGSGIENNDHTRTKLNIDSKYDYKYCTIFNKTLTLGKIRGGYWADGSFESYKVGATPKNHRYLKKKSLENALLYKYLSNSELPICPFDDPDSPKYHYVIFGDGSVFCTCPECNK